MGAIAEIAGGQWLSQCADAYQKLTSQDKGEAVGAMLLEDIQKVFQERCLVVKYWGGEKQKPISYLFRLLP